MIVFNKIRSLIISILSFNLVNYHFAFSENEDSTTCGSYSSSSNGCGHQQSLLNSLKVNKFYINGTWVDPSLSSKLFKVMNPSTGELTTSIFMATKDDVDAAVESAGGKAFIDWSQNTSAKERKEYVQKLLEIYRDRWDDMGYLISLEMGAPLDVSLSNQVGAGEEAIVGFLEQFEKFEFEKDLDDNITTILMQPIGVAALITPWNWPLNQITLKVIPALLVGCTCVLKPSELSPLSALFFAQMMHDAGFPAGVFNLVNGDGVGAGQYLSSHSNVQMVSFTGSTRAGAQVSLAAAPTFKRVSLEMGGKGANIIFTDFFEDLDNDELIDEIITQGIYDAFDNTGQTCSAPTRMLVEQNLYDLAVKTAIHVANDEIIVQHALDQADDNIEALVLGPLISESQYQKVQNYIATGTKEGAKIVAGGLGKPDHLKHDGYFVKPTIFVDCVSSMTIMQEEIFGPVLCIVPFSTEQEAVDIANDTPYGLLNYVYTSDTARQQRIAKSLQSGMINFNGSAIGDGSFFGGIKASGNGREGGIWGFEEFCITKSISGFF